VLIGKGCQPEQEEWEVGGRGGAHMRRVEFEAVSLLGLGVTGLG